jgi:NodT family efflux transporter outer membrane factor (OMF) lipoprotein
MASVASVVSVVSFGCMTPELSPPARLRDPGELAALPRRGEEDALPRPMPKREYWRALGDAQLDRLMAEALAESPDIRMAETRVRYASALLDAARGAMLPGVDAALASTRQRYSENGMTPAPLAGHWGTDSRWTLGASFDPDFWGRLKSAAQGAEARRQAALLEAGEARLQLSCLLARAWVEFDRLHAQRALLAERQETRKTLENLYALRARAGIDSDAERVLQEQEIAVLEHEGARLEERLGLQRNLIAALAGQEPAWGAALPPPRLAATPDARLPASLPADFLGFRPDVAASRWRVEAAGHEVETAKKQFYPNIDLSAFIGFQSIGLAQLFRRGSSIAGVAPALNLPLFDPRLQAGLDMTAADYDLAVELYNGTLINALREVSDHAASLHGVQRQSEEAVRAMDAAARHARLAQTRREQGIASEISLLLARLQVMARKSVLIDLRARGLDAALSLDRALGGGLLTPAWATGDASTAPDNIPNFSEPTP